MKSNRDLAAALATETNGCLKYGMTKIEHCLKQLNDEQVWWRPNEEMNSIGNLLLHLAGNLRQWIIAGVGDRKDSRDRPSEFAERRILPKDELLAELQSVVQTASQTLTNQSADDLLSVRRIQGWEVTKLHASLHATTHFQGHVQEIISMTRQQLGEKYEFEWTPTTPEQGG